MTNFHQYKNQSNLFVHSRESSTGIFIEKNKSRHSQGISKGIFIEKNKGEAKPVTSIAKVSSGGWSQGKASKMAAPISRKLSSAAIKSSSAMKKPPNENDVIISTGRDSGKVFIHQYFQYSSSGIRVIDGMGFDSLFCTFAGKFENLLTKKFSAVLIIKTNITRDRFKC